MTIPLLAVVPIAASCTAVPGFGDRTDSTSSTSSANSAEAMVPEGYYPPAEPGATGSTTSSSTDPATTDSAEPATAVAAPAGSTSTPVPSDASSAKAPAAATAPQSNAGCTVSSKMVPSCGAWWGVAPGHWANIAGTVADFESTTGARTDMYRGYHKMGEMFPAADERALARDPRGQRLLLLSLDPTSSGKTWAQIAAGAEDAYLDRLSAYIKANYREKFLLILQHEPEMMVRPQAGSGMTAVDFRNMFRHISARMESKGSSNVLFTVIYQGVQSYKLESWWPQMYPGDDVVDWLGWDVYSCVAPDPGQPCIEYKDMVNRRYSDRTPWVGMYNWATRNHPGKPLVIAEFGAYDTGGTRQADVLRSAARQVQSYPAIKAISYWNSGKGKSAKITAGKGSVAAASQFAQSPYFRMTLP